MNDKILFWLDADITTFGIAKFLQEKITADFFAIIDITNRPKKFFNEQKIIKFQKTWFYHDHIQKNKKPDLKYLVEFEKKYNYRIWELVCNDRMFYAYNDYYEFSSDEILSILEQECRLFESVLDESGPDFFITHETALQHHNIFHKLCRLRGVKILMLNIANYQLKCYISQDRHKIDYIDNLNDIPTRNRSIKELQEQLETKPITTNLKNLHENIKNSKMDKLKSALQFLLISNNDNSKTHYTYFGRTKIRVLLKEILFSLKRRYRERFINNHLVYDVDTKIPYVYLPLHQEPERSLLIAAPFYTNQVENIKHVIKSLPVGFKLYVKEHPTQGPARGWRKISTYKEIMKIPNVILIHPSFSSKELIKNCSLVVTAGGTSCFEAAFYEKPSILFADLGYRLLPSVHKLNCLEELSDAIKTSLEKKVDVSALDKYLTLIENNSFDFDYLDFELNYHQWFYYGGHLVDVDISIEKMELFLSKYSTILEKVAMEHIKKIQQHKMMKTNKIHH